MFSTNQSGIVLNKRKVTTRWPSNPKTFDGMYKKLNKAVCMCKGHMWDRPRMVLCKGSTVEWRNINHCTPIP